MSILKAPCYPDEKELLLLAPGKDPSPSSSQYADP